MSWLARFISQPEPLHCQMVSRVLGYVERTSYCFLIYVKQERPQPVGYGEADWATDPTTRQSVSGYMFYLGNNTVSWSSKKQKSIALSSCEAQFISLSEAIREGVWLRRLVGEVMASAVMGPTMIGQDNQAAIFVAGTILASVVNILG